MEPAVSRLEAALAATEIRSPRIPVISNVDAQPHADPDTMKKILARQVCFCLCLSIIGWKMEIIASVNHFAGHFPCSMGNNSEDSSKQRAEEKL